MGLFSSIFGGGGSSTTTTTSNDIEVNPVTNVQTNINLDELANATLQSAELNANATIYNANKSYMSSIENLTETQKQNAINNDLKTRELELQKQELAQSASLKNKEIDSNNQLELLKIESANAIAQNNSTISNNFNESVISSLESVASKLPYLVVIGGLFYILKKGG